MSDGAPSRWSILAIAGFVLAVIPCCPPVNLVGATLGLLAGRRIAASPQPLRGRGLARAAVVAGVCLSLLSTLALIQFSTTYQQRNERLMTEVTERFLAAAVNGDTEEALRCWVARAPGRPDAEAVARFGENLEQRYGTMPRVQIPTIVLGEGFLATRFEAALFVYFRDEACTGWARYQAVVVPGQLWPDFLLIEVAIDDGERGELRLPELVDG